MKYETQQNDMLDAICHQYYQGDITTLDAVLDANPGIAKHGAQLPAGLVIELPDIHIEAVKDQRMTLWD
ncbi:tail protein X [Zooshikella marina]|uniref:tail protein X n=1 Tax=Zooshikella ganghwensis TaxID=202772 RepID=UPI001BB09000|nr:tail protein X [Zooshikella ganghwensis]MBU2708813.1 tail protein X [Zooshikella ganghwensis]